MVRILRKRNGRRLGLLVGAAALFLVTALLLPAGAVLPGSPSSFESGNDPSLGLGNMVHTGTNADWDTVQNEAAYQHLEDGDAVNTDDSFTPGQKQDTTCPAVEGHKNPPKDDFTDVASFTETNDSGGANDGDVYFYGATIRHAANGNASENIELKQGTSGLCPGSTDLLARTPGDKLLAIDYLGGGSAPEFHVLTWIASGTCFVGNNTAPCWGETVLELDPTEAEGGVNNATITALNNPIDGTQLVAGRFAEFGVNLTDSDIIPPGECEGISQIIWESRSSGSSFVSSTKDITIEDVNINNCGTVEVTKTNDDDSAPTGAVFTLYEGADTTGDEVGTCTVDAAGDCVNDDGTTTFPPSFVDLEPGTYTIDETTVPAGFVKDADLPDTFTVAAGESVELAYTNVKLEGALVINKNSTKGEGTDPVENAGAEFSVGGPDPSTDSFTVVDNGALDEDDTVGVVCVSALDLGDYTVNETAAPDGYGGAPLSEADQSVTVVDDTDCGENLPAAGATATFTNPPLSDIIVAFRDGGSGETSLTSIDCEGLGDSPDDLDADALTGWDDSVTHEDIAIDPSPRTITCEIVIDP
ncbi:MAG TPA: SpaA isopeptide-forming pilin-related protein [Actinomycetota bacterium]|nr:SpaA isopeptide-forming pilin-related protein [Actinomycetota bacterium]